MEDREQSPPAQEAGWPTRTGGKTSAPADPTAPVVNWSSDPIPWLTESRALDRGACGHIPQTSLGLGRVGNRWVLGNRVQDSGFPTCQEVGSGPRSVSLNITRCPFPRGAWALVTLGVEPAPVGTQPWEKRRRSSWCCQAPHALSGFWVSALEMGWLRGDSGMAPQRPPQQGGTLNQHPILGEERTLTTSGPRGCRGAPPQHLHFALQSAQIPDGPGGDSGCSGLSLHRSPGAAAMADCQPSRGTGGWPGSLAPTGPNQWDGLAPNRKVQAWPSPPTASHTGEDRDRRARGPAV